MTDWKALCEELSEALCGYEVTREDAALILRARAALAAEANGQASVVGEPSEEELNALWNCCGIADEHGHHEGNIFEFARAVLARYGHQPAPLAAGEQRHPAPVPVTDRLPSAEDCDAEGKCWWWVPVCPPNSNSAFGDWQMHLFSEASYTAADATHWLPATALPLPQGEVQP